MVRSEPHALVSVRLPLDVYMKVAEIAQARQEKKLSRTLREAVQKGIEVIAAAEREGRKNG